MKRQIYQVFGIDYDEHDASYCFYSEEEAEKFADFLNSIDNDDFGAVAYLGYGVSDNWVFDSAEEAVLVAKEEYGLNEAEVVVAETE